MGVIDPKDAGRWPFDSSYDQRCFMCGDPVPLPAVYWQGMTGTILLHGQCARNLAVHLASDAMQLKHYSNPDIWWRKWPPSYRDSQDE